MRNWPYAYPLSNNANNKQVGGNFDVTALPHGGKEETGHSCIGGWYLAINPNSKNQDAAWEFIHWMMMEDAQKLAAYSTSFLVTLQSIYNPNDPNNQDLLTRYPYLAMIPSILKNARIRPRSPRYPEITSAIQQRIHAALETKLSPTPRNALSPQDALKALQNDLRKLM